MFQRLEDNGLTINLENCEFAVEELDFLGHRLSTASITPLTSSLQVMYNFPRPHTIKDLQQFLGMVNFYRRFLPKIVQILVPLINLPSTRKFTPRQPGKTPMVTIILMANW
jgi:hypothetical protein